MILDFKKKIWFLVFVFFVVVAIALAFPERGLKKTSDEKYSVEEIYKISQKPFLDNKKNSSYEAFCGSNEKNKIKLEENYYENKELQFRSAYGQINGLRIVTRRKKIKIIFRYFDNEHANEADVSAMAEVYYNLPGKKILERLNTETKSGYSLFEYEFTKQTVIFLNIKIFIY